MEIAMRNNSLVLALLALAFAGGAVAAPAPARGVMGGEGPIDLSAPEAEVNDQTCRRALLGGAKVSQGLTVLTARNIVMTGRAGGRCTYEERIEADTQVIYVTPEYRLRADRAVYERAGGTAVFTGNVVVLRGQDVITSGAATVNIATGEVKATGGTRMVVYPAPQAE